MNLTDEALRTLIAHGSEAERQAAAKELRARTKWKLIKLMPNPTGKCEHGKLIEWDNRGYHSSGYPLHIYFDTDGRKRYESSYCNLYATIVNGPPSARTLQLRKLIDSL